MFIFNIKIYLLYIYNYIYHLIQICFNIFKGIIIKLEFMDLQRSVNIISNL